MRRTFDTVVVVLSASLSVFVTAICIVCITVYINTKKLRRKPSSVFAINLLITHLFQGVVVLPAYAFRISYSSPKDPYSSQICDLWRVGYMLIFYGTCINVMLVAIDRFIIIRFSLSKRVKLERRTCLVICTVSWIYILLLCLIPFLPIQRSFALKNSICSYNHPAGWSAFMLIGNCAVPFLIICGCYGCIVFINEERFNNIQVQMLRQSNDRSTRIQNKLNKITIQITLWYAVTWIPSIIYYGIITIRPQTFKKEFYESDLEHIVVSVIKFIKFFDAVFAPLVYCYHSTEFKCSFNQLFRIKTKRHSVDDPNTLTTHKIFSAQNMSQVTFGISREDKN